MSRGRVAAALAVAGAVFISAGTMVLAVAGPAAADPPAMQHNFKVFVCKYVGKPRVSELLQGGGNPLSVSVNSIPNLDDANGDPIPWTRDNVVGHEFADAHGQSLVIAVDDSAPGPAGDPGPDACPQPDTVVTPGVVFHDPTCADPAARYDGKNAFSGVNYRVKSGAVAPGESVTIEAVPEPGYDFPNSAQTLFTHTFGAVPTNCGGPGNTVVTPTVVFEEATCAAPSVVATAFVDGAVDATERQMENRSDDADNGVTFRITSGSISKGASVTITATAAAGFEFAGGASRRTFTHDFADAPDNCGGGDNDLTAPSVSFTEPTCERPNRARIALGNRSEVDYGVTGAVAPGESVTVFASPKPGFKFAAGTETTFDHTFPTIESLECPTVAPTETVKPRPTKKPHVTQPPVVLGTQTGVPTAVAAGLPGTPGSPGGSSTMLVGYLMLGGGVVLLSAGGWARLATRRTRVGAHEL
jgi:hypothetical protein